jgi:transposase
MHHWGHRRIETVMSRPIGTPEELERRRYRAVELIRQGESVSTVARFLGVDRSSVTGWRQQADRYELPALAARPHPHRPAQLSDAQLAQLEQLLAQGAAAHGWSNHLWTTARVAVLIERHFGIRYHHDHVGRFLRRRLRWSVQKPTRRAGNAGRRPSGTGKSSNSHASPARPKSAGRTWSSSTSPGSC